MVFFPALDRKPQRTSSPRRTTQLRIQDRALRLAESLIDLPIRGDFHEQFSYNKHLHLTKAQRDVREDLTVSARDELRSAFPVKAGEVEERRSLLETKGRRRANTFEHICRI
ncbi:hypothetical protein RJZ56_002569 [Blastomyces dermatitidis]|uniref:Uncharacterized protein n=1 Tax=Blastomyces gilchristii (strain SLH14081) TaxID=559298 RepID=A0A179UDK1_BLAGS|nr:uncharacterized protein BDBG_01566 [Blastomyces gilchristii SLH14081]EQL28385.1 hypothetical protein BDFG_08869 [Blastomyces dermatitidis ATCC 26199]OAT05131.1 hypothetical protein BDBG_01566 [Blastomyces gilchristii SLH14081]